MEEEGRWMTNRKERRKCEREEKDHETESKTKKIK